MKCWNVNKVYEGSRFEEVLGIKVECETSDEAVEVLEKYGFEVIDVNEVLNCIRVKA